MQKQNEREILGARARSRYTIELIEALREKEHLLATLHLLATHEKEGVSKVDKWTVNAIPRQQEKTNRKESVL